jgi:hypothetical protein
MTYCEVGSERQRILGKGASGNGGGGMTPFQDPGHGKDGKWSFAASQTLNRGVKGVCRQVLKLLLHTEGC